MTDNSDITRSAINTLRIEAQSVANLVPFINTDFVSVVKLLLAAQGRLVITGIGKSANIANKIVATLNSTGQPAIFMHAADAIHGDLGNVQKNDVVLCISKSGNSPEIQVLVPLVQSMGNVLVGMTGNVEGFLGQKANFTLNTTVEKEACPNNLAPTASTTAQLAMGDALAVALMEQRGFSAEDFAKYHPGGALGKKLFLKMKDLLQPNSDPQVRPTTPLNEVIITMTQGRVGAAAVTENGKLMGIVTDGDLRRWMQRSDKSDTPTAAKLMGGSPKTIEAEALAVAGFQLMEANNITQIVVTQDGAYLGIVHLHDILKEGIY